MGRFEMPLQKRICAAQTSALSTLRIGPSNPALERTAHQRRWWVPSRLNAIVGRLSSR